MHPWVTRLTPPSFHLLPYKYKTPLVLPITWASCEDRSNGKFINDKANTLTQIYYQQKHKAFATLFLHRLNITSGPNLQRSVLFLCLLKEEKCNRFLFHLLTRHCGYMRATVCRVPTVTILSSSLSASSHSLWRLLFLGCSSEVAVGIEGFVSIVAR